jgi:2-polyprenyl-6-hydroxyphenyl methylase/3-demethylubiquinone-9 3-methyltransferase
LQYLHAVNRGFVNREAEAISGERIGFSFGRNWLKFVDGLDDRRVALAEESLRRSFGGHPLAGETFLDLGSGSGLFSLAALRSGAAAVVSVDVDANSVLCAEELRRREGAPERWTVLRGSVLDDGFRATLEPASRVYSWGVLHHTGDMWRALEHALALVAPNGLFALALYNPPRRPHVHLALKRTYNRLPAPVRPAMAAAYGGAVLAYKAGVQRVHPVRHVREYAENARGMSFWRDVEDWLGGLPWEYATSGEVTSFVEARGFAVVDVQEQGAGGNNEYLLQNIGLDTPSAPASSSRS